MDTEINFKFIVTFAGDYRKCRSAPKIEIA